MFGKLFAKAGLSLDRLRALVEVGAAGSIVRAAVGDPARQSQFSRQIKELEDFFEIPLVERHGKIVRLTANGRELARISRFFLLGLSNFQRGCLAEGQSYRIGASATFNQQFLLPLLAQWSVPAKGQVRFIVETASQDEVERRLHELTLDFGVVTRPGLSHPLQTQELGRWGLTLWAPKRLYPTARAAAAAHQAGTLPLAAPAAEFEPGLAPGMEGIEAVLVCENFMEARALLDGARLAAYLPNFLPPANPEGFHRLPARRKKSGTFAYLLAWNPRLLRLNPHAARRRDALVAELRKRMA
jgi:DNA-binding transcriptional LysR family regulator